MVRGMIHNDKNSPQKKDRKRRRLVKGLSANMVEFELPSTLQKKADAKQIKEIISKSTLVANVSTAPSRLKIVIPASRKMTTCKDYAKPTSVDDDMDGGCDDEILADMRTKRKADGIRDDYEDDCEEDDEDVPLTMRKSQLEKRKKKVLELGKSDYGARNKKKDKGKAPMPDPEDDGDDFVQDLPLTLRKHQDERKKSDVLKEIVEEQKKKNKGKAKLVDHEDVLSDFDDEDVRPVSRNERKLFQKIKHRGQMYIFVEAVQKLNAIQRKQVAQIGFRSLLKLCSIELPRHLCRWLVENYHPRKGKIVLPDGSSLGVADIDVEICLGIPRGQVEVVKIDPKTKMHVMKDWRTHIGRDNHEIRNVDVAKKMLECVKGGKEFIQDFIVLFHSCIVEPQQSGAANQTLVRTLESVDGLASMNWCNFVIKCLIEAKKKWDNNNEAYFTGPLFFLTILYLDRVVLYNHRDTPRCIPAFIGWNDELIKKRQNSEMRYGGFGDGNVEPQQQILDVPTVNHHNQYSVDEKNQKLEFNRSLGQDLRELAAIIVRIAEKTNNIPEECKHDDVSKVMTDAAKTLLGVKTDSGFAEPHLGVSSQVGRALTQSQDPFWSDPELIKMVEEIEAAITSRADIIKAEHEDVDIVTDIPSFTETILRDASGSRVFEDGGSSRKEVEHTAHEDTINENAEQVEEETIAEEVHKDVQGTRVEEATVSISMSDAIQPQLNPNDVVNDVLNDIVAEHEINEGLSEAERLNVANVQPAAATSEIVKPKRTKPAKPVVPVRRSGRMRSKISGFVA